MLTITQNDSVLSKENIVKCYIANITLKLKTTEGKTIRVYIASDANQLANDIAKIVESCVNKDISIDLFPERQYISVTDNSAGTNSPIKATGTVDLT